MITPAVAKHCPSAHSVRLYGNSFDNGLSRSTDHDADGAGLARYRLEGWKIVSFGVIQRLQQWLQPLADAEGRERRVLLPDGSAWEGLAGDFDALWSSAEAADAPEEARRCILLMADAVAFTSVERVTARLLHTLCDELMLLAGQPPAETFVAREPPSHRPSRDLHRRLLAAGARVVGPVLNASVLADDTPQGG